MKLGMRVGLGTGYIVLDWDPVPPPPKGTQPPAIFGRICCGQTAGWIKTALGMKVDLGPGHIVLDRDPAPPKRGAQPPPLFGPCLLWPNSWMDEGATWYEGRPRAGQRCARCELNSTPRGTVSNFRPMSVVAKRSPIAATAEHLFTFRVRRRRREMYIGHARPCVYVSVCPSPHSRTTVRTRM